ncbi:MAG: hypothetical protein H3C55_06655 [Pseudorhodoplanes sp.]|nr:hypothetical protein [Pseudorhodoplanes sp.]
MLFGGQGPLRAMGACRTLTAVTAGDGCLVFNVHAGNTEHGNAGWRIIQKAHPIEIFLQIIRARAFGF